jgi:hypothetical protein
LRLDPSLDVKALTLPRITEMMALAAQRYGIIVRDQTGQGVSFYAEDWSQYGTDPYYGSSGLFSNQWPADLLKSFPWSRLQLLKMDLRTGESYGRRRRRSLPDGAPARRPRATTVTSVT